MRKTGEKRQWNRRGETLVEILVAILIVALSAGLFATMYSASMSINAAARKQDTQFYEAVEKLEEMIESEKTSDNGKVQYKSEGGSSDLDVQLFTQDGMTAYSGKTSAPGAGDTP